MIYLVKVISFSLLLCLTAAFAEETVPAASEPVAPSVESEFKQELSTRDSLMQVQGNACTVEKDSLRAVIDSEKAKSENWEKSYNTVKANNETCAQMLSTTIQINEKNKEKEKNDRQAAAMMTSSSFFGGIGVGLLIMWLIMK